MNHQPLEHLSCSVHDLPSIFRVLRVYGRKEPGGHCSHVAWPPSTSQIFGSSHRHCFSIQSRTVSGSVVRSSCLTGWLETNVIQSDNSAVRRIWSISDKHPTSITPIITQTLYKLTFFTFYSMCFSSFSLLMVKFMCIRRAFFMHHDSLHAKQRSQILHTTSY